MKKHILEVTNIFPELLMLSKCDEGV